MEEEKIQQARPAPEDWETWKDYRLKLRKESPDRLENGAKQLITLITLVIAIYGALGVEKLQALPWHSQLLIKFALFLWLLSAFGALWVVVPSKYELIPDNTNAVKELLDAIISSKRKRLNYSLWLFGAGIVALGVGIILS
ncbi:MAG: hypothetical protein H6573_08765 [Lewinellaceae bacterium]|nr:hypothetical protein [Phaeodactylibacter sp.]MCB9347593.1 hypothetical protein [Lewinellaceae bacterium]